MCFRDGVILQEEWAGRMRNGGLVRDMAWMESGGCGTCRGMWIKCAGKA